MSLRRFFSCKFVLDRALNVLLLRSLPKALCSICFLLFQSVAAKKKEKNICLLGLVSSGESAIAGTLAARFEPTTGCDRKLTC